MAENSMPHQRLRQVLALPLLMPLHNRARSILGTSTSSSSSSRGWGGGAQQLSVPAGRGLGLVQVKPAQGHQGKMKRAPVSSAQRQGIYYCPVM